MNIKSILREAYENFERGSTLYEDVEYSALNEKLGTFATLPQAQRDLALRIAKSSEGRVSYMSNESKIEEVQYSSHSDIARIVNKAWSDDRVSAIMALDDKGRTVAFSFQGYLYRDPVWGAPFRHGSKNGYLWAGTGSAPREAKLLQFTKRISESGPLWIIYRDDRIMKRRDDNRNNRIFHDDKYGPYANGMGTKFMVAAKRKLGRIPGA